MCDGLISSQTFWPTSNTLSGGEVMRSLRPLALGLERVVPGLAEERALDNAARQHHAVAARRTIPMQSGALRAQREFAGADGAAGVEPAHRDVKAVESHPRAVRLAVENIGAADEFGDIARLRLGVERQGIVDLLDAALVHHRDAVRGRHRLGLVVGHVNRGDAEFIVQRRISLRISSRRLASRLDSGSSSSRISGCTTSARANATRCCWPPESSLG